MKHLFIYTTLLLFIGVGFLSCDSTTSPESPISNQAYITSLSLNPDQINFSLQSDGFKDTVLAITLHTTIENADSSFLPEYTVTSKNSEKLLLAGQLQKANRNEYQDTFELTTTTTTIDQIIINVLPSIIHNNYAQSYLRINGFSNFTPEIIETESPELINRPQSGSVPATFTAKVTDTDGQETIDKVFLRVISQTSGEVQGSPFEMYDDGSTYNDEVASDSVYTWSLPVEPTNNNPNRDFNIEFFAIDKGGLSSDTVRTTFSIRE